MGIFSREYHNSKIRPQPSFWYLRSLRFPARMLGLRRSEPEQTGCYPFQCHKNYAIALVSLHVLNNRNKYMVSSALCHLCTLHALSPLSAVQCALVKFIVLVLSPVQTLNSGMNYELDNGLTFGLSIKPL